MLGSLPRFSVPACSPNSLFALLARRTRDVESVTDIKSGSQGVEELRSPGIENQGLTAIAILGPGRQQLQESTKSYERTQYVIENKQTHIENKLKTNSILSVFCADRTQKVRSDLKIVARASRPRSRGRPAPPHGQDARATAGETPAPHVSTVGPFSWFLGVRRRRRVRRWPSIRKPQDGKKIQKSWERTEGVVENKGHHL